MPFNWATELLATFFGFLDEVVYTLVNVVLTGLYNISETRIFTGSSINEFTDRIYVILGIFMLFKLAFSLLSGIVNPDKANDKQSGMQKIIIRVVITLSLLLMVPTIFDFAYRVQGNILKALPQVILGPNNDIDTSDVGKNITLTVLTAFVHENKECDGGVPLDQSFYAPFDDISKFNDIVSEKCPTSNSNGEKIFMFRYNFLVSTVIGIIMVVFLVLICIDVAIRLIKLSILQIIAPIPIMTYIDPKSEKDGAFSNWTKECIQTYISLFLQLGVIYVMIFLISGIATDISSGNFLGGFIEFPANISGIGMSWVFIFIVIGAFFFMRQAPKFLLKVLGIKEGIGLGIGLASGIRGLNTLAHGGGLGGALASTIEGLDEGANANAEGKSAFSGNAMKKSRDLAAKIKTGDPNAEYKSLAARASDYATRVGLERHGVNDASLSTAKTNIEELEKKKAEMDRYLQGLQRLKTALATDEGLDAKEKAMQQIVNTTAAGTDEHNAALAELDKIRGEKAANAVERGHAEAYVKNILNNPKHLDAQHDFDGIKYDENVHNTAESFNDLIVDVSTNSSDRSKVISKGQEQLDSNKSTYKAANHRNRIKGKPADNFVIGGDINKIDQLNPDNNK